MLCKSLFCDCFYYYKICVSRFLSRAGSSSSISTFVPPTQEGNPFAQTQPEESIVGSEVGSTIDYFDSNFEDEKSKEMSQPNQTQEPESKKESSQTLQENKCTKPSTDPSAVYPTNDLDETKEYDVALEEHKNLVQSSTGTLKRDVEMETNDTLEVFATENSLECHAEDHNDAISISDVSLHMVTPRQ